VVKLPMVKKFDDMFSPFDTMAACDGRTNGQTDGQTSCHSISIIIGK